MIRPIAQHTPKSKSLNQIDASTLRHFHRRSIQQPSTEIACSLRKVAPVKWLLPFVREQQLKPTVANTKATDFICPRCDQNYELKAFRTKPKTALVDGAYSAMMGRILDGSVPTLMMLERNEQWEIQSLTAIHHLFLTPDVVEQRKPLSANARRAGWIGCNIRLDRIVSDARIEIVSSGRPNDPRAVRNAFQRFENLKLVTPRMRGWTTMTLQIIRSLQKEIFTLKDLYEHEGEFAKVYPGNSNIRPKIRQQLQVLRDLGFLEFLGTGAYRILI